MENSLVTIQGSGPLAGVPATSFEDFQGSMFNAAPNKLAQLSHRAGTSDTVLHVGSQLTSQDIAGRALTIIRVGFASIPITRADGTPEYAVDANGEIIVGPGGEPAQKFGVYPVCRFKEAPEYFYNGGSMLKKNIEVWAKECGDDIADYTLPGVNKALEEIGGVRAYFAWKEKRDGSGQKYMNMILA